MSFTRVVLAVLALTAAISPFATGAQFVAEAPSPGCVTAVRGNEVADVFVSPHDAPVVQLAAQHLVDDIMRVTGKQGTLSTATSGLSTEAIIVGTLGQCKVIDQLAKDGKLDTTGVAGNWECFVAQVITDPLPGIKRAFVIAGSDRRGTAYGIYTLSEQIGVSPWYWWADVPPKRRESLYLLADRYVEGPPSVRYRGIFINDETWGLLPWSARTFAPEESVDGDGLGPKTYSRVYELMLRLKANLLWPAMHLKTKAFNAYPENKVVADQYAIVMGSSHCEPMLRNNIYEWHRSGKGPWHYGKNRQGVRSYWEERARTNGQYENIYTLGMRGTHDGAMPGGDTQQEKVALLQQALNDQRDIIERRIATDLTTVPQILCTYKEVLELYQAGLSVPDDVTIVFSDAYNSGYLRQLPLPGEMTRPGGFGLYHHISSWGSPAANLWLADASPALLMEEMRTTYEHGVDQLWILNVGDIKPGEICTELFLRMAWDMKAFEQIDSLDYLADWAEREFGARYRDQIAQLMTDYFRLAFARKAEWMGSAKYSVINYGDEAQGRIEAFHRLQQQSEEIYGEMPSHLRDAYFELVHYPVLCSSLMTQKFLYARKSLVYSKQGRASAIQYAAKARAAYEGILAATDYYNNTLANGKWRHMMDPKPRGGLECYQMPEVAEGTVPEEPGLGIALEGSAALSTEENADLLLPAFDMYGQVERFVDVFNKGTTPFEWRAEASHPWIKLNSQGGRLTTEIRLKILLDWSKVPTGTVSHGSVKISGAGRSCQIGVTARRPLNSPLGAPGAFVESDGCISMEAEHFTEKIDQPNASWHIVRGLGRTGDVVTIRPSIAERRRSLEEIISSSPVLRYRLHLNEPGRVRVKLHCLPTHPWYAAEKLSYAIAFDNEEPRIVDVYPPGYVVAKDNPVWRRNIMRSAVFAKTEHLIDRPGLHMLQIWMVTPGVVLDKIVVDRDGVRDSYLGPPESRFVGGDRRGTDTSGTESGKSLVPFEN